TAGQQFTNVNNWVGLAGVGGNTNEAVTRIDQNVSDKQRIFGRFAYSNLLNLPVDPFKNGVCQDRCAEKYGARSIVLDDSYSFSPTLLLDINVGYNRFAYNRTPLSNGFDVTTIGWPSSLNAVASPQFRTFPFPVVDI